MSKTALREAIDQQRTETFGKPSVNLTAASIIAAATEAATNYKTATDAFGVARAANITEYRMVADSLESKTETTVSLADAYAAFKKSNPGLASFIRYSSNVGVGYMRTAGQFLNMPGETPEEIVISEIPDMVKFVGNKVAREIMSASPEDQSKALTTLKREADKKRRAANAKAPAEPTEKTDAMLLTSARGGIIAGALKLDKTDAGKLAALEIIAELTAHYGITAPVAPKVPVQTKPVALPVAA